MKINKLPTVVVIGASAGGMSILRLILRALPSNYSIPIVIAQHIASDADNDFIGAVGSASVLPVAAAYDKKLLQSGEVIFAPAEYHLLIEKSGLLSLSIDPPVNWARPSIDVLFESAADAFGEKTCGILLTGANDDGAKGLHLIAKSKGITMVQDPNTCEAPTMPQAALNLYRSHLCYSPGRIIAALLDLHQYAHHTLIQNGIPNMGEV